MDFAVSAVGLVALLPVMAAVAFAVAIDSGRPVLFSQIRVGRHGRPFRIWKFRSMDAGRVTRVGRILRASKLDELPQLWNVLRGEMSLVGPRPELPKFVARFPERYRILLRARPGLTDPASLAYRHEERSLKSAASPEDYYVTSILPAKMELSERYLRERTMLKDVGVLVKTARRLLS
jgi:lipopolysaccharide/colanic/teichoic acid biosynthesis glycosyltransferase